MKVKKFSEINEQKWIFDDPGNQKAIKSYMKKKDKIYKIEVGEPFVITTKESDDFYKLKFILEINKIDFRYEIKEA